MLIFFLALAFTAVTKLAYDMTTHWGPYLTE